MHETIFDLWTRWIQRALKRPGGTIEKIEHPRTFREAKAQLRDLIPARAPIADHAQAFARSRRTVPAVHAYRRVPTGRSQTSACAARLLLIIERLERRPDRS